MHPPARVFDCVGSRGGGKRLNVSFWRGKIVVGHDCE